MSTAHPQYVLIEEIDGKEEMIANSADIRELGKALLKLSNRHRGRSYEVWSHDEWCKMRPRQEWQLVD